MPSFLFLGDLVGRPGRRLVIDYAQRIREKFAVDWLIVNGENAAGGSGITAKIAKELLAAGVDGITLGDHVWDKKNFENRLMTSSNCVGQQICLLTIPDEHIILEKSGFRLAVLTVLGRNYLQLRSSCPFEMVDRKLEELRSSCSAI